MGDSVLFDGIEYISSKRAAQESGYTKDYIGQLARSEKIDARMVGRSWYVRADALHKHDTNTRSEDESMPITTHLLQKPTGAPEGVLIRDEEKPAPRTDRQHMPLVHASAFTFSIAERQERERRIKQDTLLARANIYFAKHTSYEAEAAPLIPLIAKHTPSAPPTEISVHEIRVSHGEAAHAKIKMAPHQTDITRPVPYAGKEIAQKKRQVSPLNTKIPGTKSPWHFFIQLGLFFFTVLLLLLGLASFFFERSIVLENNGVLKTE